MKKVDLSQRKAKGVRVEFMYVGIMRALFEAFRTLRFQRCVPTPFLATNTVDTKYAMMLSTAMVMVAKCGQPAGHRKI
jgi:hypothetical protein